MVDLFEKYLQGQQAGQAKRRQRTLAQNYMGATQGDQNALAQVYSVDPEAGMQAQTFGLQQRRAQRQEADDDIIRASKFYLQTKSPQAWSYIHQKFSADPRFQGMPAQITTPEDMAGSEKFAQALVASMGGADQGLAPRVVGDALVDAQGRVLYQAPAQQDYQWSDRAGAWIPKPTGPIGAAPSTPRTGTASNGAMYSDDPSLAALEGEIGRPLTQDERRQIAAGTFEMKIPVGGSAPMPASSPLRAVPVEGIGPKIDEGPEETFSQPQPVTYPDGSVRLVQFGNRGSRREVEGVAPPPTDRDAKPPTEGERKAATLLQRLNFSLGQLQSAVKESPSAASPRMSSEVLRRLPLVGEAAANAATPAERQRVESAQLDILDAALTLGTGAAYTREQLEGYRRSYFPQIGDSPTAIRDKAARLDNVINAARIAAGRAAAEVQPANRSAPAQKIRQPAARSAPASTPRRLKFNPQTGKIE